MNGPFKMYDVDQRSLATNETLILFFRLLLIGNSVAVDNVVMLAIEP